MPRNARKAASVEWPAYTVERWPIERLKAYERNARTHSPEQIEQLRKAIRSFGWTVPVLAREDGTLIAGHGRLTAALAEGITEAPVIVARGWSEEQCRAYALADNKIALNSGWDDELLGVELSELKALGMDLDLTGFGVEEVVSLISPKNGGLTDPDQAPAAPDNPASLLGDLWLLGEHRVFCGDATKREDIERALGGIAAQMVFTDPPYGVAYKGGMKPREALSGDHLGTDIYDSSLRHLSFAADDKAALYLWYADGHVAAAAAAAAAAGYHIVAQIIWAKNHAQFMTSAHYKGKHEPCLYGHRRGKSARWHGPNNEVTLWEVNRAPKNEFHPTQKPVDLAARAIRNSTAPTQRVLDLFLGSGSTIIAAEMEGRTCVGLEIEPAYIDVLIHRWQDFTGKAATLDGDGRSFAEIETARSAAQRKQRKKAA